MKGTLLFASSLPIVNLSNPLFTIAKYAKARRVRLQIDSVHYITLEISWQVQGDADAHEVLRISFVKSKVFVGGNDPTVHGEP